MGYYESTGNKQLRKIIFERDKNNCQFKIKCKGNNKKSKLIIHHLDCNPYNNVIENLITLCRNCHMSFHRKDRATKRKKYQCRQCKEGFTYAEGSVGTKICRKCVAGNKQKRYLEKILFIKNYLKTKQKKPKEYTCYKCKQKFTGKNGRSAYGISKCFKCIKKNIHNKFK